MSSVEQAVEECESLKSSGKASQQKPIRPREEAFTAEDRAEATILFGGLTWKHEQLIEGLLAGAGYRCQHLPETDRAAHEIGKEYCSSGMCNPVYFTVGNLIRFLQQKEAEGQSRQQIVRNYVYFTAACGGPCRFGMYESQFRLALNAAGYEGFRVLSFSQDQGIHAETGHSGLQFSVDFGMNAFHSFVLGDLLNIIQHKLKPYEKRAGATERAIESMTGILAAHMRENPGFELGEHLPRLLCPERTSRLYRIPNTFGKLGTHLYSDALKPVLTQATAELNAVEIDWLRVRPVVKVIGEFWAQMTESDGNFRMHEFLEKEGAEVSIEPISTWILYLAHQRREKVHFRLQKELCETPRLRWLQRGKLRLRRHAAMLGYDVGVKIYLHHFLKLARLMKMEDYSLPSQKVLAELAEPYFNTQLRGGEGHLEIGKTLYTMRKHKSCHMVLALKPFGCLPSVQSDAVQAALVERFAEVNFLSIETAAEGAINAYSRVQMALSEAKAKAELEFTQTLAKVHHSLDEIRAFVATHRELRHPLCPIPHHPGVVSTAANFLLHADKIMSAHSNEPTGAYIGSATEKPTRALESMQSTQEFKS
jgi:predicted nucleotide-binding protein (sugar kinase/HSP70/actin superfamily)